MGYKDEYEKWLTSPYFDEETKKELLTLNEKEKEERFYKDLEFGTGGLRGILGAGTNRMNIYTVRRATQGLCNYILAQGGAAKEKGVVIAYDSRRFSPLFALNTALVCAGNNIKAYLFPDLRPTPVLSFAVRHLGATAGVVITASHNPPEYNGYKAYWSDGGQIPYPKDEAIISEVNRITDFSTILVADKEKAIKDGLLVMLDETVDNAYMEQVKAQSQYQHIKNEMGDKLTIVYTPLHGAGNKPVRRVLNEVGFSRVFVVPEQEAPDENFTTVSYPNPEDPKAFTLAMKLADEVSADIVVATDPDADRVGAVVKNAASEYVVLTGNMTGVLLTEYLLSQMKQKNTLPKNAAVISTIVSTNMTAAIAKAYGVYYTQVLTGFKYIGEKIKEFEETNSHHFVFGFEESYGCLAGTYCRDKDAVVATMLICEMAAYYKSRNMSLWDGLQELYQTYGYYREAIESITLKGKEGIEQMVKMMESLRNHPPKEVGGIGVVSVSDYKRETITTFSPASVSKTDLPVSDVLYYTLADDSWFCVRPSGTEPKIKIYFGVKGETELEAKTKLDALTKAATLLVNPKN